VRERQLPLCGRTVNAAGQSASGLMRSGSRRDFGVALSAFGSRVWRVVVCVVPHQAAVVTDDRVPGCEARGHFSAVGKGGESAPAGSEVWRYPAERGEEPLRMSGGGEAFHLPLPLPLPLSGGLVGW
jgi:hypothetical protein